MISLEFHGPFHFSEFNDRGLFKDEKKRQTFENPNKPGIYIWGFKYPDENKFIPYYVGQSSSKSIFDRIKRHIKDAMNSNSKYTRLSESFMKSFYIHEELEKLVQSNKKLTKQPNWFESIPLDGVEYLNARWFIHLKSGNDPGILTDYPISLLKPANDFLKSHIDGLFFCYSIPKENDEVITPNKEFYENLESITKNALKGKTFGNYEKSLDSNTFHFKHRDYSVYIKNKSDLSDRLFYIFKEEFSKAFPGY